MNKSLDHEKDSLLHYINRSRRLGALNYRSKVIDDERQASSIFLPTAEAFSVQPPHDLHQLADNVAKVSDLFAHDLIGMTKAFGKDFAKTAELLKDNVILAQKIFNDNVPGPFVLKE